MTSFLRPFFKGQCKRQGRKWVVRSFAKNQALSQELVGNEFNNAAPNNHARLQ